jgi:hypothetical protein
VTSLETPNGKTSPPDLNFSGSSSNALAGPPRLHRLYQYAENIYFVEEKNKFGDVGIQMFESTFPK